MTVPDNPGYVRPSPNADSGRDIELMCSACGFKGTPIVVAAHDCALDGDEQALADLERAENLPPTTRSGAYPQ